MSARARPRRRRQRDEVSPCVRLDITKRSGHVVRRDFILPTTGSIEMEKMLREVELGYGHSFTETPFLMQKDDMEMHPKRFEWSFLLEKTHFQVHILHSNDTEVKIKECKIDWLSQGNTVFNTSLKKSTEYDFFSQHERQDNIIILKGEYSFEILTKEVDPVQSSQGAIDAFRVDLEFEIANIPSQEAPKPEPEKLILKAVKGFFLSEFLSDVSIICRSNKFPAHKIVLAGRSSVFAAMFKSDMQETRTNQIEIEDFDPRTIKAILCYIYTGRIEAEADILIELYNAVQVYQIEGMEGEVRSLLLDSLSKTNAVDIYQLGELHQEPLLQRKSFEIIKESKADFAKDEASFLELTTKYPSLMLKLFKTDLYFKQK